VIRGRRSRRAAWASAALVVLSGFPILAGCGNPTASVSRCLGASDATVAAIQDRLTLRNGKMVKPLRPNGYTMVSAELHPTGADKQDKGDILTWAARDVALGQFESVDVNARDDSGWPHASFGVSKDGVIESRACTGLNLGKTKAQLECEQNRGNSNVNVGGSNDCAGR
jgi:hypothetical protein